MYRAADSTGNTIEFIPSAKREVSAAKREDVSFAVGVGGIEHRDGRARHAALNSAKPRALPVAYHSSISPPSSSFASLRAKA